MTLFPTGILVHLPIRTAGLYKEAKQKQRSVSPNTSCRLIRPPSELCSTLGSWCHSSMLQKRGYFLPQFLNPSNSLNSPVLPMRSCVCGKLNCHRFQRIISAMFNAQISCLIRSQQPTLSLKSFLSRRFCILHATDIKIHITRLRARSSCRTRCSLFRILYLSTSNLDGAFLTFLSVCETAKGDNAPPDQAIHLAAAMLFAGCKSVVGTMW